MAWCNWIILQMNGISLQIENYVNRDADLTLKSSPARGRHKCAILFHIWDIEQTKEILFSTNIIYRSSVFINKPVCGGWNHEFCNVQRTLFVNKQCMRFWRQNLQIDYMKIETKKQEKNKKLIRLTELESKLSNLHYMECNLIYSALTIELFSVSSTNGWW